MPTLGRTRVLAHQLIAGDVVLLGGDRTARVAAVAEVGSTVEVTFEGMNPSDPPERFPRGEAVVVYFPAGEFAGRLRAIADVLSDDPDREDDVYALLAAARAL